MNENLKGIFSAISPVRRSFINERLLAKAVNDTELLAVVYPEVEFMYRSEFEDRIIDKFAHDQLIFELERIQDHVLILLKECGSALYGSTKSKYFLNESELKCCIDRAVYAAAELASLRVKYSPIQICEIMEGFRESVMRHRYGEED